MVYIYLLLIGLLSFVFYDDIPTLLFMIATLILFAIIFRKKKQPIISNIISNPLKNIFAQPKSSQIVERLKLMCKPLISDSDYNRLKVYDISDNFSGKNVAYTSDKSSIYICTKNKTTGEPEEFEVLVYVFLHELTHFICSQCIQHDTNFSLEFLKMLKKADLKRISYKKKSSICGAFVA